MELSDKLTILGDSAKYDVACTSSGSSRRGTPGGLGNTVNAGLCHSFAADGRCISLLKVLMTNVCVNDCAYCVNRRSNDVPRATFSPEELAKLTIEFYKRNYIEGLFLSSGILVSPDYTMERMCRCVELLRNKYHFNGYIHAKAIPGASQELITKMGLLCDRMSVNIELPSEQSLTLLAPEKNRNNILKPMGLISSSIHQSRQEMTVYRHAPSFAPAGQSTQMIVGATPDSDFQIMRLSQSLYQKYRLKRVFYSAYIPVGTHPNLPAATTPPPLLREHRLYQADWLLRFYGFSASELLDEQHPNFHPMLDPKCHWALRHMDQFPVEVNTADYSMLLRVPGIGVKSAQRIRTARRESSLDFDHLRKLGVVLKRAVYFITCRGRTYGGIHMDPRFIFHNLVAEGTSHPHALDAPEQLSLFDGASALPTGGDRVKCLTGQL